MRANLFIGFLLILSLFAIPQEAQGAICKVGDKAKVHWGSKWWSATVIGVNKAGNKCKIHYKGYGSNWDEWVGPSRIRISGNTTTTTPAAGIYGVGQSVKVKWGGKWWSARILEKKGNRYYIKYDGYSSKWNEWVGLGRMRSI